MVKYDVVEVQQRQIIPMYRLAVKCNKYAEVNLQPYVNVYVALSA